MSAKAIREFDGKRILAKWLKESEGGAKFVTSNRNIQIDASTSLDSLPSQHPWLLNERLVAKPDQLIKRRGKSGLLLLNATWAEVKEWVLERLNKPVAAGNVTGLLKTFIVEPFVPHEASDEYYVCIHSEREGDEVLFYHEGGVDIGDVDSKAERWVVPVNETLSTEDTEKRLLTKVTTNQQKETVKTKTKNKKKIEGLVDDDEKDDEQDRRR
jgi:ATP citrate (pro-S)-lyase